MVEVGQSRSLMGDIPKGMSLDHLSDEQIYAIKLRLFEILGYKIHHPEVERFHKSNAKVKVVSAARRTTKSYSAAHDIMLECIFPDKARTIWMVGPNYGLAGKEFDYIHKALVLNRKALGIPRPIISQNNPKNGAMIIKWPWGTVVEGKSSERPEGLLGEAVDRVIYSEAGQLNGRVRDKYVQPTLMTTRGKEIIPTTPEDGAEWVHDLFLAGYDEKYPWISSFTWDGHANPLYDWETFNQQKQLLGENNPIFREQFLGSWEFYGGRVYPQFKEDIHVIEPFDIPDTWRRYRGLDFGHRDPFVCLWMAVGPLGECYFYNEYHKTEGLTRLHAQKILDMTGDDKIQMTVADRSAKQLIQDMNYEGVTGIVPCNNDLQAGRMQVANYLNVEDRGTPPFPLKGAVGRYPRLYIFNNCENLIREFKYYRWREKAVVHRQGDVERTEGDDHCFHPDTEVITKKGIFAIKDLVGTTGQVISDNGEWENYDNCRMTRKDQNVVEVLFDDGDKIACTPDHKFKTTDGWVEAKDLDGKVCYNNEFLDANVVQDFAQVKCVGVIPKGKSNVYCLEVLTTRNFCVGKGKVVSNCLDTARYILMMRPKPRVISRSIAVDSVQYEINKLINQREDRWQRPRPRLMNTRNF